VNLNILVSAPELDGLIKEGGCVVVDCRFDFADSAKGRNDWLGGHVPGAAYAHLDEDLSSPIEPHTGRHPLPSTTRFASYLAGIGWAPGRLLVAYDEGSNAVSSRLWWLMRYFGQPAALLDGGLAAWIAAGLPLEKGAPTVATSPVPVLAPAKGMTVDSATILDSLGRHELLVLDARASQRFSGAVENLDTRAGHIPGSVNRPFGSNLTLGGGFKDAGQLREEFSDLLDDQQPVNMVHSCGSGVTACHNLFAMELAGLPGSRLYPGSWSEWIRDPARPIETGN
jgi:thiosulfate/3-mercaptopyruvate sulfurtransferase